jgi:hypothetical protein
MSEAPEATLFSLGDCPICGDTGDVLVLRSKADLSLVFVCTLCCLAWRHPPSPNPWDFDGEYLTLKDVAPRGIEFPLFSHIQAVGFAVERIVPMDHWVDAVKRGGSDFPVWPSGWNDVQ